MNIVRELNREEDFLERLNPLLQSGMNINTELNRDKDLDGRIFVFYMCGLRSPGRIDRHMHAIAEIAYLSSRIHYKVPTK